MVKRCCWPPESMLPRESRRSLTSSAAVGGRAPGGVPGQARCQGHVVVYRQGQPHRQGKNDADATAQRIYIAPLAHVSTIEIDLALDAHIGVEYVHPIDDLEKRGLAGIGRANDAEDLVFADFQIDIAQGHRIAVANSQILDHQFGVHFPLACKRRTHHFFLPLKYMRNAMEVLFITKTMAIKTRATP